MNGFITLFIIHLCEFGISLVICSPLIILLIHGVFFFSVGMYKPYA